MNIKTKLLFSFPLTLSLAVISCANNSSNYSTNYNSDNTFSTSHSLSSSSEKESASSETSSSDSSSSSDEECCENDLHDYVRYVPVQGGHRKQCEKCEEYLSEKEDHVFFNNDIKYCPSCGYYDEAMRHYFLPDAFNVTVNANGGTIQRSILNNLYIYDGGVFTLSSPNNAHGSYADFNVGGARFYYDNQIDDGTKLFMLKETSNREKIGTCKTLYTYTLYLFDNITPDSFAYEGGHISIDEIPINDWLNSHTSLNQFTYKYLSIQHHAEDNRTPVPGTNAVIVEVACKDCGEFLYQEVVFDED